MQFKQWLYIQETVDPKDVQPLQNLFSRNASSQEVQDFLNPYINDPNKHYTKPEIIQAFNAKFSLAGDKKKKPTSDDANVEQLYQKFNIQNATTAERQIIGFFISQNANPASIEMLARDLRQFTERDNTRIGFNTVPTPSPYIKYGNEQKQYQDIQQLISAIHNLEHEQDYGKQPRDKADPHYLAVEYKDELVAKSSNSKILVFKAKDPTQCRKMGKGQIWCIASSSSVTQYFNYRHKYGQTQYFIFDFNKSENDPARYVNPGVAPDNEYSEWVDARNLHKLDPYDAPSHVGIHGYNSIRDYVKYLQKQGVDTSVFVAEPITKEEEILRSMVARKISIEEAKEIDRQHPNHNLFDHWRQIIDTDHILDLALKAKSLSEFISEIGKNVIDKLLNVDGIVQNAARSGNLELVKYLIEKDAKIGYYAVENAARLGNLELVKYLIEKGAKIGDNAVNNAAYSGNLELVKYLVDEKHAEIGDEAVEYAAESGNLKLIKYLVDEKYAKIGDEAVEYAAKKGNLELVKYLIEKGAKIGYYAVTNATESGDLELVKYLVDEKNIEFDVEAVANAVKSGNLELVKYLVDEKGVYIGNYAVDIAISLSNLELVKYLVKKGAEIGYDAVQHAASSGNLELVKYLVEKGAYIGNYAVDIAISLGNLELVKYLVKKGAYIDDYAVQYAAKSGNLELVQYLVEKGGEIGNAVSYAKTPEIKEYLLQHKNK